MHGDDIYRDLGYTTVLELTNQVVWRPLPRRVYAWPLPVMSRHAL